MIYGSRYLGLGLALDLHFLCQKLFAMHAVFHR